jgi:hypothetical protein
MLPKSPLLLFGILIPACYSTETSNVQVDLVFPKNNTEYLPVWPFPVVFALHNFSVAWKYRPTVEWSIGAWDERYDSFTLATSTLSTQGVIGSQSADWGPPPDKYLWINSTSRISYYNESDRHWNQSRFSLSWSFRLGDRDRCTGPGFGDDGSRPFRGFAQFYTGKVFFNVSNSTGVMPDLVSHGPCALELGAVGYQGPNSTEETCPLLSWPRPNPTPCAFTIDSKAVDQVSKAMVNRSGCGKKFTWPSRATDCSESGSNVVQWSSSALLLSATAMLLSSLASV